VKWIPASETACIVDTVSSDPWLCGQDGKRIACRYFRTGNSDARRGLHAEDGGSKVLRNVRIPSYHYMAPQPRSLRLNSVSV